MALFTHEDDEGDALEVMEALNDHRGQLVFNFACRPTSQGVFVTHDRVAALHAVLGEWLGNTTAPTYLGQSIAPNSLIDQLIIKRVKQEVERVMPLYLAPQAAPGVQGLQCDYDCSHCRQHDEDEEPTPQEAGHPEEPKYIDAGRLVANRLLDNLTLMSDVLRALPERTQPQPTWDDRVWGMDGTSPNGPVPECRVPGCGHRWGDHLTGTCSVDGCTCARYQSAP